MPTGLLVASSRHQPPRQWRRIQERPKAWVAGAGYGGGRRRWSTVFGDGRRFVRRPLSTGRRGGEWSERVATRPRHGRPQPVPPPEPLAPARAPPPAEAAPATQTSVRAHRVVSSGWNGRGCRRVEPRGVRTHVPSWENSRQVKNVTRFSLGGAAVSARWRGRVGSVSCNHKNKRAPLRRSGRPPGGSRAAAARNGWQAWQRPSADALLVLVCCC